MTIVFDCFKLAKGTGKSIGIYNVARNLIEALSGMQEFKGHIVVLGNRRNRADFEYEGVLFREIPYPFENKWFCVLWELFLVPFAAKKYHPDKVVFPRGFVPLLHITHNVIIVHDLIPFYYHKYYPESMNRLENFYIMWRLRASVKRADTVITISKASRNSIMKMAKRAGKKTKVIYNGCGQISAPGVQREEKGYIAAVTSCLPHKNASGIVQAYGIYRSISQYPLPLKILGVDWAWMEDKVPESVKPYITCVGYLDNDPDFYTIIAGAKIFLFLSLVEGFGLPPVEAMQLGVPVVCSDRSSMPEITGNAAILVNPERPREIASAMKRLDEDKRLWEEMRRRGYERSSFFSWDKAKEEYGEVLGRRGQKTGK